MPPLSPELFLDSEKLSGRELALAELRNFSDAPEALSNFNWNGKLTGFVVLGLSNDNKQVTGASFGLAGLVDEKEMRIETAKLWPNCKANVFLVIRGLEGHSLMFSEGGLWSDLLPDEEMAHLFVEQSDDRAPSPLLQADYEENGIGRFCIRMNCQISKNSTREKGVFVKFTLLVLPGTAKELLAKSPLVRKGEWPGIKLGEGEFQLGPAAKAAWGCPLVPLIISGTAFSKLGTAPRAEKLRRAVNSVLGKAVVPETSRSYTALQTKWDRLIRHPEESGAKAPAVTWPAPSEPELEKGKK